MINAIFHSIAGKRLHERDNERYAEYRRDWEERPRNFIKGEFPLFIDIEVTSRCNLRCPFCASTERRDLIKRGDISFDTVRRIIDEGASKGLYGVKFNCRGEPLMHKEIVGFVEYAKSKGLIDVYFNTNGTLLTPEIAERLIESGMDRISFSFEGTTKERYEASRVGARFESVLSNIERFMEIRARKGSNTPLVRVQSVVSKDDTDYIEEYRRFWSGRVDEVAYLDCRDISRRIRGKVATGWACAMLWQRMLVWWDGTIFPCNQDEDGLLALGNVNEMTIEEAWKCDRLTNIRQAHIGGVSHTIEACNGCYQRDYEIT